MSETKHTPGPWSVGDGGDLIVTGPCDEFICGDVPHVHDARLIASAPELLEALTACRNELSYMIGQHNVKSSTDGSWMYDYQTVAEADAAIAKARGGQQ